MERIFITTVRLPFSPGSPEDRDAFRPIATDPEVMRYITNGIPWTDAQIDEFISRQARTQEACGFCFWKLLLRDSQCLAGFCGLPPCADTGETEIGWWLAGDLWGRGLATEASRAALEFACRRAGLRRVVAVALPENAASRHLMEKLGMHYQPDTVHKGFPVVLYSFACDGAAESTVRMA
jgi:RimJ/RimL family protein N-acetyltransferase